MMQYFNQFSKVYGLRENTDKSSLYEAGISVEIKDQLLADMHFSPGILPFRYLGVTTLLSPIGKTLY